TGGVIGNLMGTLLIAGEWDEAEALYAEYQAELESAGPYDVSPPQTVINLIRDARGGPLEPVVDYTPEGDPVSELWMAIAHTLVPGTDAVETSRLLTAATEGVNAAIQIDDDFTIGWPIALERALAVGVIEDAERLLALVGDAPPGLVNPLAHAHHLRLRALVNRAKGAEASEVAADLEAAVGEFRAFGVPFYLAKALLELGAPESLEEARDIFSRLGATPWLAKAQTVSVS
ncbi:MAG: hypothetical protein QOD65_2697, partial [Gaiellales bacterium]|nr:hypothetical protein [Gaiellales bacterium]